MKAFFKWLGITILELIIIAGTFATYEWNTYSAFYGWTPSAPA